MFSNNNYNVVRASQDRMNVQNQCRPMILVFTRSGHYPTKLQNGTEVFQKMGKVFVKSIKISCNVTTQTSYIR